MHHEWKLFVKMKDNSLKNFAENIIEKVVFEILDENIK